MSQFQTPRNSSKTYFPVHLILTLYLETTLSSATVLLITLHELIFIFDTVNHILNYYATMKMKIMNNQFNKLRSVFHASVLFLIINFVIVAV